MIERIRIRNFQSIEEADIELGPLTVLIGPGRSGKSAVIRAIRSLLTNQTGDGYIRHGAKETEVTLIAEGQEVTWKKQRGKGGVYVLANETFHKTGGEVPPAVVCAMSLRPLDVDPSLRIMPNLQEQHDAPFLISESGSTQAKIIGSLTKLDAIVRAQQEAKRIADKERQETKVLSAQLERVEQELATLPDVDKLRSLVDQGKEMEQTIEEAKGILERAKQYRDELRKLEQVPNVTPTLGRIRSLLDKVYHLIKLYELAEQVQKAAASVQDAELEIKKAKAHLAQKQGEATKVYQEAGLCDHCPLRVSI